jgi:hypothetical protein
MKILLDNGDWTYSILASIPCQAWVVFATMSRFLDLFLKSQVAGKAWNHICSARGYVVIGQYIYTTVYFTRPVIVRKARGKITSIT